MTQLTTLEKFQARLREACAVSLDDGPHLSNWRSAPCTGHPDNQIAYFAWTDGEHDFSQIVTEAGARAGTWGDDGSFLVEDHEGDRTRIRFYRVQPMTDSAPDPATVEAPEAFGLEQRVCHSLTGSGFSKGAAGVYGKPVDITEAPNDTPFEVRALRTQPLSPQDNRTLSVVLARGEVFPHELRVVLQDLVNKKVLPEGDYLVRVSW